MNAEHQLPKAAAKDIKTLWKLYETYPETPNRDSCQWTIGQSEIAQTLPDRDITVLSLRLFAARRIMKIFPRWVAFQLAARVPMRCQSDGQTRILG